ncbi:MAG TPA: hypothetical protein VGM76_19120 [Lacipirellulaceae bacterium]
MEQDELLRNLCESLERLNLRYLITGSQATIAYGEPRFTNDIDVLVALDDAHTDVFVAAFPESDFYLSREAVREAIRDRGMFNIIHPASGLKIDVIIPENLLYDRGRFERGRRIQITPDFSAVFASPEDVILKKLQFYQMGKSDKHLRDIAGVLRISGDQLDHEYIAKTAKQFRLTDEWQLALRRAAVT